MSLIVPAVVRGKVITDNLVSMSGRGEGLLFDAPDPSSILSQLSLGNPGLLKDAYALPFDEVVSYLDQLSSELSYERNDFLQEAMELSVPLADVTRPVLEAQYRQLGSWFTAERVKEVAQVSIGVEHLDGWSERRMNNGSIAAVRAIGARCLHIIAGNSPMLAGLTILCNALTRGDAVIKVPSNDPLTASALIRTMIRMAPEHPITRHVSCAYWKGGDVDFENGLYTPRNFEKILAWGGYNAVKHVTRYIQPGLELISLDPKRSATVIGSEAFSDEATMRVVARNAAADIGTMNQIACVNARLIYVASGTDEAGISRARRLGEMIYEAMLALPEHLSTKPKQISSELAAAIVGIRSSPDFFSVIGGHEQEGAIIVSHTDEEVEFYPLLASRVANIVPLDDPSDAISRMTSYSQTIGVYPESLKRELRDVLPLYGAQRLVSLGGAFIDNAPAVPQDAIELIRRMAKWIVDDTSSDAVAASESSKHNQQQTLECVV